MLLLRDGTEVNTGNLAGLGPYETRNFSLSTIRGATGGTGLEGAGHGSGYGAWHSPSSTDIEAKHSTKTVWVKGWSGVSWGNG